MNAQEKNVRTQQPEVTVVEEETDKGLIASVVLMAFALGIMLCAIWALVSDRYGLSSALYFAGMALAVWAILSRR